MSWITGLADKAENILNKLDQNAATALQTPANSSNTTSSSSPLLTITSNTQNDRIEVINRIYPANSLQRVQSLSPKRTRSTILSKESPTRQVDVVDSIDFHQDAPSNISSRRSSLSSHQDSVTIDMSTAAAAVKSSPLSSEKNNNTPSHSKPSASEQETQELAAFKIALADVSSERDELKTRLLALTDSSQLAMMQNQLAEMEILINRLTIERDQIQMELHDTLTTNKGYMHSISQLESNIAKVQQEYIDVSKKLQMQIKETEQQRLDLIEYRKKAQLALQMKDQMINELKSPRNDEHSVRESSNERLLLLEVNALKEENKQFQEEIEVVRSHLDNSKANLKSMCRQHEDTIAMLRANEDSLRKDIRSEKEHSLQLESELRVLNQELVATRKQMASQMENYSATITEKDRQLEKIKASYSAAQADPTAYETRIRSLTQTLVDKQNSVEAITAERNALKFQLEKAENQLKMSAFNSSVERSPLNLANHTDDVKAQFPILMRENPFDNRVARRMKRAYSTLDSAGIRLGAFLRRYPLMRIAVLMYVGLLHLWVMFVLLSSTPT